MFEIRTCCLVKIAADYTGKFRNRKVCETMCNNKRKECGSIRIGGSVPEGRSWSPIQISSLDLGEGSCVQSSLPDKVYLL